MNSEDIRWIQRFNHFNNALNQLTKFIEKGQLNELEEQGLIQAFEYTHELAWKTLKDFVEHRGIQGIYGSRDATRAAFRAGLIENGEIWMDMIHSRNLSSHTYNEAVATKISTAVLDNYFNEFLTLRATLNRLKQEEEE